MSNRTKQRRSGGLSLLLYQRTLHPELFRILAADKVSRRAYEADIWLVEGGHVITLTAGKNTLTEVIVTHHEPTDWAHPEAPFTFVTDGIESAVAQAKAAAGGKSVGVHGADTVQQLLNGGLLDEISVDIAAVLLGSGVRLFDHLAGTPAVLGNPTVTAGVGVTHLRYPVRKA